MNNVFLSISLKILSPLIFFTSVYVLLKGHNEPGGGFIGGLLAALSWTLVKIGSKREDEQELQKTNFYVMGLGLLLAMGSGLASVLLGKSAFTGFTFSVMGFVNVSTVLLFDLGVYIVILVASIKMLRAFMD